MSGFIWGQPEGARETPTSLQAYCISVCGVVWWVWEGDTVQSNCWHRRMSCTHSEWLSGKRSNPLVTHCTWGHHLHVTFSVSEQTTEHSQNSEMHPAGSRNLQKFKKFAGRCAESFSFFAFCLFRWKFWAEPPEEDVQVQGSCPLPWKCGVEPLWPGCC